MENKASNNEDYMESYVMDLILMDGTRAEDITAFSSREVLWPSGIVKDDYGTIDKGVQILTVSDPKAYGEYKPYTFLSSQEEFIQKAMKM